MAYCFKQVFVDDGWNTVFNTNIPVGIDPDISFIAKHGLETVAVEFHSLCGAIAFRIEHTANFSHGFSVGIELERFLNDVSCLRVNYQFVIFNLISERNMTSDTLAFQSRLSHATGDFLR